MKLSVVVLTYNQENTIGRALDSILSQEHPYSMEIIVADDASNDRTPEIVSEYANKFPDIIKPILRKQNLGLIGNYFDTISRCSGEYIAGCAGDDYWLPNKIDTQISYLDSHPDCMLTYSDALIFNQSKEEFDGELKGNENNSFQKLIICNHIPAVTICFRNTAIQKYITAIKPHKRNWMMEDYPFILWVALTSTIKYIPLATAVYQLNESSISQSSNYIRRLNFEQSVLHIRKYFLKLSGNNKGVFTINKSLISNYLKLAALDKNFHYPGRIHPKYLLGRISQSIKIICLILAPHLTMKYLLKKQS